MCILALVVPQPGGVLQVAANRDEFLKRPAAPPSIWEEGWLAPRDLEAGGTWLGLNPRGLFVGVTNRAGVHRVADRRSRGLLVTDALRAADVPSLHQELAALPADRYNAFHLAYADGTSAGLTWSDGERLHQELLGPGLHVITERSLGAGDDRERVAQLRRRKSELDRARDRYQKVLGLPDLGHRATELARLAETLGRWPEARGWAALVMSDTVGGGMIRRLLPAMTG